MAVSNETQDRDAQTNETSQLSRFGHDPLDLTAWGELLDEAWGKEFDRRLAAWETEFPAPMPKHHEELRQPH